MSHSKYVLVLKPLPKATHQSSITCQRNAFDKIGECHVTSKTWTPPFYAQLMLHVSKTFLHSPSSIFLFFFISSSFFHLSLSLSLSLDFVYVRLLCYCVRYVCTPYMGVAFPYLKFCKAYAAMSQRLRIGGIRVENNVV